MHWTNNKLLFLKIHRNFNMLLGMQLMIYI